MEQFVHDHLDDFIDILERLFWGCALLDCALVAERRAISVVATLIRLHDHFERVRFHSVKAAALDPAPSPLEEAVKEFSKAR